jgi:hypothetical protein
MESIYSSAIYPSKKAQVTLFIIVGVVLVTLAISFFILRPYISERMSSISAPEAFLEDCVKNSLKNTETILINNNLKFNPNFSNYYMYKSEKVPFFCTTFEFYGPCIPQEPGLITNIQRTLENRLMLDMQSCFQTLRNDFESAGYSVSEGDLSLNLFMAEKEFVVKIEKQFVVSNDERSLSFKNFEFFQPSPLYNLIKTAQTIVNYESSFCEFNELNWMMISRAILISKFVGSDSTKVYILKDKYTNKEIKFAVKSCVMPAGL